MVPPGKTSVHLRNAGNALLSQPVYHATMARKPAMERRAMQVLQRRPGYALSQFPGRFVVIRSSRGACIRAVCKG